MTTDATSIPDHEKEILRDWVEGMDYKPKRLTVYKHKVIIYFQDETYIMDRSRLALLNPNLMENRYDYFRISFE